MSAIQGFPSNKKDSLGTGLTNNFVTVVPTDPNRTGLDVLRFAFRVDDPLNARVAGAGTGIEFNDGNYLYWVEDTSTPARPGDFVRFEDGPAAFLEIPIVKVETNRFLLAVNSGSFLPVATNTFFIMRYATQRVDDTGSQIVIASPGPTQFVLDGLDVEVEEDTVTPANNKPLPVKIFDSSNVPFDPATEATLLAVSAKLPSVIGQNLESDSLSVVLASDQGPVPTLAPVNTGGFYDEITNLDTTPQTFPAPANAVGFVIEALSSNVQNVRYKIGAVASATSGMRLEPGRSENFNSGPAANIYVAAEAGTNQVVTITWILSS